MTMHPSTHNPNHNFAINKTGTRVLIQFFQSDKPWNLTGESAKRLRDVVNNIETAALNYPMDDGTQMEIQGEQIADLKEFLNRCELRTDAEAAALGEPPPESDADKGERVDLNDGTHAYGKTPEEIAAHRATAKANHDRIHAEFIARQNAAPAQAPEDTQ